MESADSRSGRCCINTALEIRIKDFRTAAKQAHASSTEVGNLRRDFEVSFFASAFPNGQKEWLVVFVRETVEEGFLIPNNAILSWIVSVIDVEGNSRLPRSFQKSHPRRYLESSFILKKADEFLPGGVLTLRWDIYYSWDGLLVSFEPMLRHQTMQRGSSAPMHDFFRSVPQAVCPNTDHEARYPNDSFTVFDFTAQILTLPQFHETRKSFGVYGIPPCSFPWLSSETKEINADHLEHIWMFETYPDKFILSLDDRKDTVGARLLKTSPFIRRCVSAPMKERFVKRIDFSNVDSKTFRTLLFFLEIGTIPRSRIGECVEVYKFSHLYQLEHLQKECADHMMKDFELPEIFPDLQRIAEFYADEHFLTQLFSRVYEYQNENCVRKAFEMIDRPDSDCYI